MKPKNQNPQQNTADNWQAFSSRILVSFFMTNKHVEKKLNNNQPLPPLLEQITENHNLFFTKRYLP